MLYVQYFQTINTVKSLTEVLGIVVIVYFYKIYLSASYQQKRMSISQFYHCIYCNFKLDKSFLLFYFAKKTFY